MNSGIYCIINKINNKIYIGQSKNLLKRKKEHKKGLKYGKHHNSHLQNAYDNYGKENFFFKILMYCPQEELNKYEDFFINIFDATNRNKGYNILEFANENPVNKQEVRDKIGLSNTGKIRTEEWKAKASYWNRGKRNAMYGKPGTWLGKKFSEEHKQRISKARFREDIPNGHILYDEWKSGLTTRELAEKYHCSKATIENRIKELGYTFEGNLKGERHPRWTGLATVSKSGTQSYNNKPKYQLSYHGKIIKQSLNKSLLEKLANMINNGTDMKIIDEEFKKVSALDKAKENTTTGIYMLSKQKNEEVYQGFYWRYTYYDENGKKKNISSVNLNNIRNKVISNGLEWLIIDQELAKLSFNENYENMLKYSNYTGIYNVIKQVKNGEQYFAYRYYENKRTKYILSKDLKILEKKVRDKGMKWEIIDDELANKCYFNNDKRYSTGIYRLTKQKKDDVKQGFVWSYSFQDVEKKQKTINYVDLNNVKNYVLNNGLEWIILDEKLAKQSFEENNKNIKNSIKPTNTGIYRVNKIFINDKITYRYECYTNKKRIRLSDRNINSLKQKVKERNLEWKIIDEELANKILKK